jgi:hypothetical protein
MIAGNWHLKKEQKAAFTEDTIDGFASLRPSYELTVDRVQYF